MKKAAGKPRPSDSEHDDGTHTARADEGIEIDPAQARGNLAFLNHLHSGTPHDRPQLRAPPTLPGEHMVCSWQSLVLNAVVKVPWLHTLHC